MINIMYSEARVYRGKHDGIHIDILPGRLKQSLWTYLAVSPLMALTGTSPFSTDISRRDLLLVSINFMLYSLA